MINYFRPIAVLAALFLIAGMVLSQPAENPTTFCNPMNLNYRFMADAVDAREAADPVMVLYQDEYYLFASRSGGYWISSDLATWDLIVPTGLDVETYAPGVVAMRDSLFYIPSASGQIYKSGDPKNGVWTKGPYVKGYGDPAFFLDDDGRLYMYYGLSNTAPIRVVELDPMTFTEISAAVDVVHARADIHGWERITELIIYNMRDRVQNLKATPKVYIRPIHPWGRSPTRITARLISNPPVLSAGPVMAALFRIKPAGTGISVP
jgi:hypothetical protein